MEQFFDILFDCFDFFVDFGNSVNFLGMNLWDISFIVFLVSCIFRFLFPVIFAGQGSIPMWSWGAHADQVRANYERVERQAVRSSQIRKNRAEENFYKSWTK